MGGPDQKGHMATPINGQSSKRLESIPNQVHTEFGWELKIIDLGCTSKLLFHIENSKVEWKNRMPKFPSKVKVINIKLKITILWIWKGHFSIWKGHFCIVCQKVEGPWPLWPPWFLRPCLQYLLDCMINTHVSSTKNVDFLPVAICLQITLREASFWLKIALMGRRYLPTDYIITVARVGINYWVLQCKTIASYLSISALISFFGIPFSRAKNHICSSTVRWLKRTLCWGHNPSPLRISSMSVRIS